MLVLVLGIELGICAFEHLRICPLVHLSIEHLCISAFVHLAFEHLALDIWYPCIWH